MHKQLIDNLKKEFNGILEFLKNDLAQIRTGRANPALVENVKVDAYGNKMNLKEVASILAPDAKTLLIQIWDKGLINSVVKGIEESRLGLTPNVEGQNIKLVMPPLIEERKKELTKLLHDKLEQSRIRIRRGRDEVWHKVQNLEKEKKISEDDKFRAKNDLQKVVDEYNGKVKEMGEGKERELNG
ncbi:MAG: ribosome recycling factor [Parcubacteria group bacterium RIFCSPLOWO2_01_FULL_40_65]|nr:MAG: ribosome recycling factor [Parcubacteria group bacterium RIFCSPHIGHO2_01_FULL_40_30]OHB18977.1 MAG: ribosome recycling factor [Parcubacteria group bacterium RIFCSPHIGHO2_02_FULL_40_12]OHB21168.1 MAG: ribosome recycling factor [Parcubacteria group bacterium RIFCSPLOWO2_01_FULL_40_65]OHB22915.1 MAG: ribosome recycling factor [Parcubacteria group bacterium RIFCSPLOWO2_02_FULL_40_12]OHB24069.1 MAG: ribosome recycling factor [Parcubacteria group bacterium RIFCSPLOWO2_12_FULL_40_10]